jgi:hypothetical protein
VKAPSHSEVQAMHLLNQTPSEVKSGEVRALVSIGNGYLRQNLQVIIGGKQDLRPFMISQNLWGYDQLGSLNLDDQSLGDSFTGLISRGRLVMFQTTLGRPYTYNASESVEVPLAAIASFAEKGNEFTFFQTPSYLMIAHHSDKGLNVDKLKINRFSFLPGSLFNDTFFPIFSKKGSKYLPSLYIDETDIQNNLVSITTYDQEELKSSINLSAYIPPICKALNPVRLAEDQGHSLSLLCLENKVWVMKFISVDQ